MSGEIFVVHNPAAGARHPDRLRRQVEAALAARQVEFEYAYTKAPGHGRELVEEALSAGYGRVLVAGGDGTVLEAVEALADSSAALALLPVGTGNQLAANMGLPKGVDRSIDVAVSGRIRKIDVGMLDEQPFACIAGAGFDAEVVSPQSEMKRKIGYLAYVQAAAGAAFAPKVSRIVVVVDGEESECTGIGVEVANMPALTAPLLARPVDLVPDGKPDDGLLDVCVLATETTMELIAALTSIISGRMEQDPRLRYFRGREVVVRADPPLPVQIDGERTEAVTPFAATVRPGALGIVVPAEQG